MKIPFILIATLLLISFIIQNDHSNFEQRTNYACSLKITHQWKKDSLDWYQKKLLERNIRFTYSDLKVNKAGYIECLSISVRFPDMVGGHVSNCGNKKSLQEGLYSIGFKRDRIISFSKGFKMGYLE